MNFADLIGHTLDGKYEITSQLGSGGMGTVYLATHLHTERPVAVKIIAPQYMARPEFVERFRREARAAGRLRHPNVVDVTDFGFADAPGGRVAYLVMEYLDGCTLGEILEEENNLPVSFSLDILEQVCSAVHEAHEQGIIHRDLKPDNIWLEPNQRGGYTVKVLDFGIAKLEENSDPPADENDAPAGLTEGGTANGRDTVAFSPRMPTSVDAAAATVVPAPVRPIDTKVQFSEAHTLMLAETPVREEVRGSAADAEAASTRLMSDGSGASGSVPDTIIVGDTISGSRELTRVGAVLGTPLYMSPEQCRGEKLDARSDVYSLGVIAYQLLSGKTPFSGDFEEVMRAHREQPPPIIYAKKARRKLKRVVMSTLAKDPAQRPQTADALASSLRARSEGIWALLRRSGMIYTEHMPKFIALSTFFYIPTMILTVFTIILGFLRATDSVPSILGGLLTAVLSLLMIVIAVFSAYLLIGTTTWIVAQNMAVPLRPIKLRSALRDVRKKWMSFAGTGLMAASLHFVIGIVTIGIGFLLLSVWWALLAPVVMMERVRGFKALKRSKELVNRSIGTVAAAVCIMYLLPIVSAGIISYVVNISAHSVKIERTASETGPPPPVAADPRGAGTADTDRAKEQPNINFQVGKSSIVISDSDQDEKGSSRIKRTILESLLQILLLPIQIVVASFTSIIVALLYLKTRQAGGEPMRDLLANFEDDERPRKKWQEKVRHRLAQTGRATSRT